MADEQNGEKLKLQIESIVAREISAYDDKVQGKFEMFETKLDEMHAGIGAINLGIVRMQGKLDSACEAVRESKESRGKWMHWLVTFLVATGVGAMVWTLQYLLAKGG